MSESAPNIIGITGGIGSGKSVVSRILRLNGYRVYDCDMEAGRLMVSEVGVINRLIDILGEEAYISDGGHNEQRRLNKKYLSENIFRDSTIRHLVNEVVHKAVKNDFFTYAGLMGGIVFCESAILSTSNFDTFCDKIWMVTAPESERIQRVKHRNSLSEDEVRMRMEAQKSEFDNLPENKVDVIFNGNDDLLLPQIHKLLGNTKIEEICLEKFWL